MALKNRRFEAEIGANTDPLRQDLKKAEGQFNSFGNTLKRIGAALGATFGVAKLVSFGKEAVKVASELEGIRKGFEQIAYPGLLDELRKATKGTVSDMQLMSRAVQASNFQIPLRDMAKLLEFASARAVQTGQSVDYLVDSIILGIGRKSPMILDNLGISAIKLKERIGGVGAEAASIGTVAAAVGAIAEEELKKMGGMAETTAVKVQQIATSWASIKTEIGKAVTESKLYKETLIAIESWLSKIKEVQGGAKGKGIIVGNEDIAEAKGKYGEGADFKNELMRLIDQYGRSIEDLKHENTSLAPRAAKIFGGKGATEQMQRNREEIEELAAAIEVLKGALTNVAKTPPLEQTVDELTALKGANKAPKTTTAGYDPSGGAYDTDKVAMTEYWVQGQLSKRGGNELAPGPTLLLTQEDINEQNRLKAELEGIATETEELMTSFRDGMVDMGFQTIDALGRALGGDAENIGDDLLRSLADFLGQFGKMLIIYGSGIEAFVKSGETLQGWQAIAAGVALIAIGGAIKGYLSNSGKATSSGGGGGNYTGGFANQKQLQLEVTGKISGKDIVIASKRYVADN